MRRFVLLFLVMGMSFVAGTIVTWQSIQNHNSLGLTDEIRNTESIPRNAPDHLQKTIEGIGYVQPCSEILRLAPRTGGVIETCVVSEGDSVKKGECLARLDASLQQSQKLTAETRLRLAEANLCRLESGIHPLKIEFEQLSLARLKTQLKYLETRLARIQTTFNRNVSSQEELDSATSDQQQAEIAVAEQELAIRHLRDFVRDEEKTVARREIEVAKAAVVEAQQSLDHTELKAPCDGTVMRWLKRPGEGVSPHSPKPIVLFGDLSRRHVRAEVDERFAAQVQKGMKAEIYGTNVNQEKHQGIVLRVE